MKWDGPMLNKRGKERNHLVEAKRMAQVAGLFVLPDVKMPRKSRSDKGIARGKYQTPEAGLRSDVIKELKKFGWRYWRIENSIGGRSTGLADFLIAKDRMIFIELKGTGGLTGKQPEFKKWCDKCGMPYFIVRTLEDLKIIIEKPK